MALENASRSAAEGNFPAGGIVVVEDRVISSAISSPYPGLLHADSKAVTAAFESDTDLGKATLYVTLESCLMCTGVAYWAGIRRIVYAIAKDQVDPTYYETAQPTAALIDGFNERLERVHLSELQDEALTIVRAWEEAQNL
ncbi:MAG: CMP/dCMP deaminase zinc-binding [Candidatus Saccharibacteria bacterium]|nr:CMP/dCMP deaminase zinc-binding [Candidatus Saccharibacteria bacterium]